MRPYAKVIGTFWTRGTGLGIRTGGRDAQCVALYLCTAPSSNMWGIYYLPLSQLCHEVGIKERAALAALGVLWDLRFALYDVDSSYVYVPEMARYQVDGVLKRTDHRHTSLVRLLANPESDLRRSPFCAMFVERYRAPYNLEKVKGIEAPSKGPNKPLPSPSKAPRKPGTGTRTGTRSEKEDLKTVPFLPELAEPTKRSSEIPSDEEIERRALFEEILRVTKDDHSDRNFRVIVTRLRAPLVRMALSDLKDAMAHEHIANPGAWFQVACEGYAKREGVDLRAATPRRARVA